LLKLFCIFVSSLWVSSNPHNVVIQLAKRTSFAPEQKFRVIVFQIGKRFKLFFKCFCIITPEKSFDYEVDTMSMASESTDDMFEVYMQIFQVGSNEVDSGVVIGRIVKSDVTNVAFEVVLLCYSPK